MTESVDLVTRLAEGRRVVLVSGRVGWVLQTLIADEWRDGPPVRSSELLRWIAAPFDEHAAAILAALPARSDQSAEMQAERAERKAKSAAAAVARRAAAAAARAANAAAKRAAERKARISAPGSGTKRAAVASAFLLWRAEQKENTRVGS